MIDRATAKAAIRKLSGQPFAPSDENAWGVLVDALRDYSETPEHAQEIIEECLRLTDSSGLPRMATVLDIRNIGFGTRKTEVRPTRDCRWCGGSGYREVRRGGYTGAEKCRCWKRQEVEDQPVYAGTPTEIVELASKKQMASGERE